MPVVRSESTDIFNKKINVPVIRSYEADDLRKTVHNVKNCAPQFFAPLYEENFENISKGYTVEKLSDPLLKMLTEIRVAVDKSEPAPENRDATFARMQIALEKCITAGLSQRSNLEKVSDLCGAVFKSIIQGITAILTSKIFLGLLALALIGPIIAIVILKVLLVGLVIVPLVVLLAMIALPLILLKNAFS